MLMHTNTPEYCKNTVSLCEIDSKCLYHHCQIMLIARRLDFLFPSVLPVLPLLDCFPYPNGVEIHKFFIMCRCVKVHKWTSLMRSSLLLQQCPACPIHFMWMNCEIGCRWLNICYFSGCCFTDLFKTIHLAR